MLLIIIFGTLSFRTLRSLERTEKRDIEDGSVLDNNEGDIEMFTRNTMKQVRAQLQTSADNAALPAFARRDATAAARLLLTAGRAAIDRYLLLAGPTAANPPSGVRWMGQTDRQTDGQTDSWTSDTCLDPAAHTLHAVCHGHVLLCKTRELY